MSLEKNHLKQRLIQGLNQISSSRSLTLRLCFVHAPDWHNWQVLRDESLSPRQQDVLARIAIKVGGAV